MEKIINLVEYRKKVKWLSDFLPWAWLSGNNVIVQKDGMFQKTIAYRGPDLGSSSDSELQAGAARLNNALKRLGTGWAFFCESQRYEINDYVDCDWNNKVCWIVDEERRGQYEEEGDHFESSYYITFVWKVPRDKTKKAEEFFIEDPSREGRTDEYNAKRAKDFFDKKVKNIYDILKDVFPFVMELNDDETLSYLHSTVSTRRHPVKSPPIPMYLDHLLCDQSYQSGEIPVLGNNYIFTATINGYPSTAWPGILDSLNHLPIEYRWTSRFICLDDTDANTLLVKLKSKWLSGVKSLLTLLKEQASGNESRMINQEAANNVTDVEAAINEISDGGVSYGFYTPTITVWDTDLNNGQHKLETAMQVINAKGFTTKEESSNSFHAWLSSLPGHVSSNPRRPLINTLNLAHVFPLSSIWSGDRYDEHLHKKTGYAAPLFVCNTTGNTPFRLSLGVGDVGHVFMGGPTGSGKSTILGFTALQWLRYPNAQVIFFDKDRSARAATMAVGGSIYEPGKENRPVSFQPLADIDTKEGKVWAQLWIETVVEIQNIVLTPSKKNEISSSLASLASAPKKQRTITGIQSLIQSKEIRGALESYTLKGPYGQLFDGDHDSLKDDFWTMIEMGSLMDMGEHAIIPALSYLFYQIEKRFDGRPTLLILDEAWLFMNHPYFSKRLKAWLKTLRKKDVYVVFATQEINDAIESPICATLLSACMTKIYLPDTSAHDPIQFDAYKRIGLTDTEIINLARATPKKEYFYRSPKGKRMFNLELGEVALAFVGRSTDEDHQFMDYLENNVPQENWAEYMLRESKLDWAADLLKTNTNKNKTTIVN